LASLRVEAREKCARLHHQFKEDGDNVRYLSQEPKYTPRVSRGSTQSFAKASDVIQTKDHRRGLCVSTILKNIGHKKGHPSGSKYKYHQDASKEGKKKWKGKYNKMTTTPHQCMDLNNHCNIHHHTEDKCWKLHLESNPKNYKKDSKKKNLLEMNPSNLVESSSDVDENIVCTSMQNEFNLIILFQKEEKEMTKLFRHINIEVKRTKVDSLLDYGSQTYLIVIDLVRKLGLEVHDHSYPITEWVNKYVGAKVTK
jgi:hypothetical protein